MELFSRYRLIELTHPLSNEVPTWNGSCGFHLEIKKDYDQQFRVQQVKMHAGIGTHLDAPSHRFHEGGGVDSIPLTSLIVPACVIDVSRKAYADYEISVEDILAFEEKWGMIPPKSLVIGYTGWDRFWSKPNEYRNMDELGQMHFPAFSKDAAKLLLTRDISGLAIDTLSPDCLDLDFPVHQLLLGQGKYIIENIANASQLPPFGGYVIALPIYMKGATEAPIRVVGLIL